MLSIRQVAVIGAGQAGRDFAARCVREGFDVMLEDVLPSKLRLAEEQIVAEQPGGATNGSLRLASTVEDAVRDADLAIDFVPDELESKLEIVCMLDRMAPPRTVLCIPTACLSLTDLASCTYRGDRCVGLRGDLMSEEIGVIHGRLTATESVDAVAAWLRRLGYGVHLGEDVEEPMLMKNVRSFT